MISFSYHSITPTFSTARELLDALGKSFVQADIEFSGGTPTIVYVDGRDFAGAPAWGWMPNLLERRSDWWPAAGIALQHAVGAHPLGRQALDDMLGKSYGSAFGVLRWLTPLAKGHDDALAKRLADLEVQWDEAEEKGILVTVSAEKDAAPMKMSSGAELVPAMKASAPIAWLWEYSDHFFPEPWRWLQSAAYAHPSILDSIPEACASFGLREDITEHERWALLDYLATQHDLWRHRALLDAWEEKHPAWWNEPATVRSCKGNHQPKEWGGVATLGSLASNLRIFADEQAKTPAVLDLDPLYGPKA